MLAIVRIRIKNTIGSNQSLQTQNAFKHFLINNSGEEDEGAHPHDGIELEDGKGFIAVGRTSWLIN